MFLTRNSLDNPKICEQTIVICIVVTVDREICVLSIAHRGAYFSIQFHLLGGSIENLLRNVGNIG